MKSEGTKTKQTPARERYFFYFLVFFRSIPFSPLFSLSLSLLTARGEEKEKKREERVAAKKKN